MYATSDPDQKPAFDSKSVLPYDNFINDLVNDLMPHIESTYSVLKNGSDHIWYEITGADHDNNAIKSGLFNLFKQIAWNKKN